MSNQQIRTYIVTGNETRVMFMFKGRIIMVHSLLATFITSSQKLLEENVFTDPWWTGVLLLSGRFQANCNAHDHVSSFVCMNDC